MTRNDHQNRESLMTRKSVAIATSPPRAPPHDSAHRLLLLAQDPSEAALAHHHTHDESDDKHHHSIRKEHAMRILRNSHFRARLPHPHLPAGPEIGDVLTRSVFVHLPLSLQNRWRDNGGFRSLSDWLLTLSVPILALSNPLATSQFMQLSRLCTRIKYGDHAMQVIDMFFPGGRREAQDLRGFVFFVHGGAWGSGLPLFYWLTALPFLELNMAVAVVGYRTYPDADVNGQTSDLERAASELGRRYPDLWNRSNKCEREHSNHIGTCLMGHSSGAHVALLMLADRAKRKVDKALARVKDGRNIQNLATTDSPLIEFDSFVGLSGPYDISHHFDYEAGRGVEEVSPMKPACGHSREEFRRNSPVLRLRRVLTTFTECDEVCLDNFLPRILLIHGVEDATVPFTATAEAARTLRSCGASRCDEVYVAQTGHAEVVMHLMLGGRARDVVVRWLTLPIDEVSAVSEMEVSSKL